MVYSFNDEKAPSRRKTQYFEIMGNRAIYHDGWIACTTPMTLPWVLTGKKVSPCDYKWELYNKYDGGGMGKGGRVTISVNGKKVAEGKIEKTIPFTYALDACFDVGEDRGTPLIENTYELPFKFTGTLEKVVIDLK